MIGEDQQQQVGSGPSHIAALVTRINAAHRTDFTLSGRFAQGEPGAFLLLDGRAHPYVLKWQPGPASAAGSDQRTALEATLERLRTAGYPAPRLVLHGVSAEHPTGWPHDCCSTAAPWLDDNRAWAGGAGSLGQRLG
jgi:hypothetical protein